VPPSLIILVENYAANTLETCGGRA